MEVEKGITAVEKHDIDGLQVEAKEASVEPVIDHVAERKLLRKMDLMIMPLVMSLYLFVRGDQPCLVVVDRS